MDGVTQEMASAGPTPEDDAAQRRLREIHSVALKRWKQCEEFERVDRRLAAEDLKFAAGGEGQWPPGMAAEREREGRPMLTINRLAASIKQVINDARQNKPGIKVIPAGTGTPEEEKRAKQKAEIYEGIVRQIEATSRAQHVYIPAYELVVRGGFRGSWRVTTKYCDDDTFDQEIVLEPILSPFSVYRDPDSKQVDHADDRFVFVCEDVSNERYKEVFPDQSTASWDGGHEGLALEGWKTADTVRLAEYWWIEDGEERTITVLDNGEVVDGEAEAYQYAPDHAKYPGHVAQRVRSRKVREKVVMRCLMNAREVLEGPHVFPGKIIPIVSVEGPRQWVGDQMQHWSLVREAKGPQQSYNFWQSAIAERIALAPKQPFIVTPTQIKGFEQMWATANRSTSSALIYNPDPMAPGPPARQQPALIGQGEIAQSLQAIDDIKATMGIFDRSLGASSQEKSGRAILAVQAQGDNATFDFPDLFAAAIAHCGRIIVGIIPTVYANKRTIRALHEDGATRSYTVNDGSPEMDLTDGKYDVQVVVGPSYATKRMEAAEKVIELANALPQVGMVGADLIVRAQDMPHAEELADRLKKTLPPGVAKPEDGEEPPPPPPPDPKMVVEMRTAKADIELKEAQAEKAEAEAEALRLQNQQLAAQLSMQMPDISTLVQQMVRMEIAQMFRDAQEEQQEGMQEMQPEQGGAMPPPPNPQPPDMAAMDD